MSKCNYRERILPGMSRYPSITRHIVNESLLVCSILVTEV